MKIIWKQILQSLTLGMVIPGMLLSAITRFSYSREVDQEQSVTTVVQQNQELPETEPVAEPMLIPVLLDNGETVQMELEEYISRVVLGEVPASFELEALKAQAIAARTYTLRCFEQGDKHTGGVCTNYRCCQAYRDPEEYLRSGETADDMAKIYYAVAQTRGQVLRYDGKLICATYFANAAGSTEDAKVVWGESYPYLKVVSSPEAEDSMFYSERVSFTAEEFQQLLGERLSGEPESWFGNVSYTVGGGVSKIRIGAKFYSGVEVRSLLDLRSTIFTVSTSGNTITFETKGYGHRVGMSQYGADAMAVNGSSCEQILAHYYPGTSLEQYD